MKNGKYCNGKKSLNMKPLAVLLALTLLIGCAVGGTIAWLTAEADAVENTFTVGDIQIDLKEHKQVNGELTNEVVNANTDYKFVPGDTLKKDPFVTVKKGTTADCYLFVKITEKNNTYTDLTGKIIQWTAKPVVQGADTADTGWTKYVPANQTGATIVEYWYREVTANTSADQVWTILKDNQVTVNTDVTKTMVEGIKNAPPALELDAAAVQKDNLNLSQAWEQLPTDFRGTFAAPTAATP